MPVLAERDVFLDKPHAEQPQLHTVASPAKAPGFNAGELLAVLWRRKVFLVFCGILGAILAVTVAKFIPHRYVANAELLVDPRDLRLLDKEVMPRAAESDSGITVVESQVQVLSSNSVLKRAIAKVGLQNDPEFNGTQTNPLSSAISRLTGLFSSEGPKPDPEIATLQTLQQRIGVKRPERTFVIDLSVSSNDPDKSVRIADAIVAAYLEDQEQYRSSSNEGAAEALDSGLNAMKQQVNAADEKIQAYKAAHDLGLASGKLIIEQQLTDANNQLALARAETNRLKARMDDVKNSRSTPESMPEIMASQTLINLKKQLATVSTERARFAAQLMPKHPVMITLQQQERDVRTQIDREVSQVIESISHDYDRAKANEVSLAQTVEGLQGKMNEAANAQIELRELERNLEVTRTLYEQSVARSRETREQSRLNTTNVRIISSAMPLPARVFPPRGVILAPLGFLLGIALGAAGVLFPLVRGMIVGNGAAGTSAPSRGDNEPDVPASAPDRAASAFSSMLSSGRSAAVSLAKSLQERIAAPTVGSPKDPPRRSLSGEQSAMPSSQSAIGVSFDNSMGRQLGVWNASPEAPAPQVPLPETGDTFAAREATVTIEKATASTASETEPEPQPQPGPELQATAAPVDVIGDTRTDQSFGVPAPIAATATDAFVEAESSEAIEPREAALAQLSRVLISDMRRASRAAQTAWLRDGTSAMATLARNAATSSDTAFAGHIRELRAHFGSGISDDARSTKAVWFVSKNAVPVKPVLALAFAETYVAEGEKVLIVDADVRTPGLTRLLIANGQLDAEVRRAERGRIFKTIDSRFDVLILTTPTAEAIAQSVDDVRGNYDIIVIDARIDALCPDLGDDNDVLFVSSNRANEAADISSSIEDLSASFRWLRGFILTAKGISTSTTAVGENASPT